MNKSMKSHSDRHLTVKLYRDEETHFDAQWSVFSVWCKLRGAKEVQSVNFDNDYQGALALFNRLSGVAQ